MLKRWPTALLAAAIIAVLTALLMLPVLRPPTGNEFLDGHDLVNQQYPLWSFVFDSVRNGQGLPLWNPYLYAGQSVVANPQASVAYPPIWLMIPLGVPRAVGLLALFHLWFGGFGMVVFLRRFGASWTGALAGGIVYELSGVLIAHLNAGHLNYVMCQAWLPWIASAYWVAIDSGDSNRRQPFLMVMLGGAAFGLCALTGYPPLLYFAGLWLVLLWLYNIAITGPARWRLALKALWPLLGIGLSGAILGAVALLPAAQLTLASTRTAEVSLTFSNSYALPASQLLTLLIPNLFGSPNGPEGYWGLPFYEEVTAYVGWLPLLALLIVRRRPATLFFGALLITGLVVSIGIDGGLFPLLFHFLPGYGLFRVPSRALYFCVIGGAGLVSWLLTDLENSRAKQRQVLLRVTLNRLLPAVGLLALIGSFALNAYFTIHSTDTVPPWRILASSSATLITALMIGLIWIVLHGWRYTDSRRYIRLLLIATVAILAIDLFRIAAPLVTVSAVDVPTQWKLLAQIAPADPNFRVMTVPATVDWQAAASYTHHLNADGYDPLIGSAYQALLAASDHDPTSPISRLLGVRYALTNKPFEWSKRSRVDQLTQLAQEGDWYVYEVKNPMPHALIVAQVQVATDLQMLDLLHSGQVDPTQIAFVNQPVTCPSGGPGAALITSYQPNSVTVAANSPRGGLLLLSDSYDPEWTVTVDGLSLPLIRVDSALRGVCVPAGIHAVRFDYQPRVFWIAAGVSVIGWLLLIGAVAISLIRFNRHVR